MCPPILPAHSPLSHRARMTGLGEGGPHSEGEVYFPGLGWGWLPGELKDACLVT